MSAYSVAVLANSPDCYYRLGESSSPFVDSVAANNATPNGAIITAASLIPTDPANAAATFDYNTSLFKATTTHTIATRPMSVEFWVKPQSLIGFSTTDSCVASCAVGGGGASGWKVAYLLTTGTWRFTTIGVKDYDFTAAAVVGVTQHVVFIFNTDNSVDLYINGAFSQNVTGTTNMTSTAATLAIADFETNYPQATIDELAVYGSALSAASILAHYNAAVGANAGVNFLHRSGMVVNG